MPAASRFVAFVLISSLLALSALGAEDKDKKADPKKDDAPKKTDVKKDDAPKKTDVKKDDAPKDVKKADAPKKTGFMRPVSRKKDADKDKDVNSEKMVKAGVANGQILAVNEAKKSIRLKVVFRVPKLNPGAIQNVAQAQLQLAQANNLQAMIDARNNLAKAQAGLYSITEVPKEYELQARDDIKVRMLNPPMQFDDKGKPKRYTQKELREMRTDDKLFPAEFADLKQDQIVQVTLVRKKGVPVRRPIKKGKDVDPDLLADYLPQMAKIVILVEPRN